MKINFIKQYSKFHVFINVTEFSCGTLIFAVWSPLVLEDSIWKMLVFCVCVRSPETM